MLEESKIVAGRIVEAVDRQPHAVSREKEREGVPLALWQTGLPRCAGEEAPASASYGLVGSAALPCGLPHSPELLNPVC